MNMSPRRWTLACLLSCAILAVMLLPAGSSDDPQDDYWWRPPLRIREDKLQIRYSLVWWHSRLLMRAYKAAEDAERANRVFGSHHETSGNPIVWFGPDIPQGVRTRVGMLIEKERAPRGEWAGNGAVGIMVVSDTATRMAGVQLPQLYDRERSLTTVVLPPSPANGNHCVTVVRLRHRVFVPPADWDTHRPPLDGCAFTDAFGAPGAPIGDWLTSARYSYARRLSYAAPDTNLKRSYHWFDEGDDQSKRCRGGIDSACVAAVRAGWWSDGWNNTRKDLSVATPAESEETFRDIGDFEETFVEALARDLGSARFQRLWRSPKPLADAYFDETGTPLAIWIRARQLYYHGPYHIGPMQPPASAFLTILTIVALAVITFRFAPRPYKI